MRTKLLIKALGLNKIARDAASEGHRLLIVNKDDMVVREVVGITSTSPELARAVN